MAPSKKNEFTWPALLRSERFWAIVLAAAAVYVESKGFIGAEERNLIATILTAFVGIRTIDRTVDTATAPEVNGVEKKSKK